MGGGKGALEQLQPLLPSGAHGHMSTEARQGGRGLETFWEGHKDGEGAKAAEKPLSPPSGGAFKGDGRLEAQSASYSLHSGTSRVIVAKVAGLLAATR